MAVRKQKVAATPRFQPTNKVATIPHRKILDAYKTRTIWGMEDLALLEQARLNGMNVLLEGPTGSGKTMLTKAYAAKYRRPYFAKPNNAGIEPEELIGKWIPDPNNAGAWLYVPGGLYDVIEHGGVSLSSEINFLPDRVASIMYEAFDGRRSITVSRDDHTHVVQAHRKNCWCDLSLAECQSKWPLLIADMNPGYSGTRDLNQALRNRFGLVITMDYDKEVEAQLVRSKTLLQMAWDVRTTAESTGAYTDPVSTNMLEEFETMVGVAGLDAAMENFANHFVQSSERAAIRGLFSNLKSNLQTEYRRIMAEAEGVEYDPVEDEPEPVLNPFDFDDGMEDDWLKP